MKFIATQYASLPYFDLGTRADSVYLSDRVVSWTADKRNLWRDILSIASFIYLAVETTQEGLLG